MKESFIILNFSNILESPTRDSETILLVEQYEPPKILPTITIFLPLFERILAAQTPAGPAPIII